MIKNRDILRLLKIGAAVFVFILAFILPLFLSSKYIKEAVLILSWLIAGFSTFKKCAGKVQLGEYFDENFLMTAASFGAVCLGHFAEAAAVMILYEIGSYLQDKSVQKSVKSIEKLINIRPLYANAERFGKLERVNPDEVMTGETIIVKPGEIIPLDGIITAGSSSIDVSSVTGESVPRDAGVNDKVLSGCVNLNGVIKVKTSKIYSDSTASRLMRLIENAEKNKSQAENFITKFSRVYTPAVLSIAVLAAVIPSVFDIYNNGLFRSLPHIKDYISHALMLLVISCPCAFVISVPLTFFAGIAAASKTGLLIKGEKYIEVLANVNTAVFDKTGTITKGNLKVTKLVLAEGVSREEFIEAVLLAEAPSNHPAALAVKKEFNYQPPENTMMNRGTVTEITGKGMWYLQGSTEILAGNKELMEEYGIPYIDDNQPGIKIYAAKNKKYLGCVTSSDEIKQNAKILVSQLKTLGIKTIMLTGDIYENARYIAKSAGIDAWHAGLMPEEKTAKMEMLVKTNKIGRKVLYTGEGLNDAPVLKRADIGIAMGAIGSEAAIEAADAVIADDNLEKIFLGIKLAKKTMNTVYQNVLLALGVKVLFILLGLIGFMTMWGAVFADTGVTLITIINALAVLKVKKDEKAE